MATAQVEYCLNWKKAPAMKGHYNIGETAMDTLSVGKQSQTRMNTEINGYNGQWSGSTVKKKRQFWSQRWPSLGSVNTMHAHHRLHSSLKILPGDTFVEIFGWPTTKEEWKVCEDCERNQWWSAWRGFFGCCLVVAHAKCVDYSPQLTPFNWAHI